MIEDRRKLERELADAKRKLAMGGGAATDSVAAGVRRIEAKTRDEARKRLEADSRAYADLAGLLRAPAGEAGAWPARSAPK